MICVVFPPLVPPTLRPTGSGGKQASANLASHNSKPPRTKEFPDHWNNPDVRGMLLAIHWQVCAYCCRYLPGNDRGDVEHFRPKAKVADDLAHGGYWWLAYDLNNYRLSCRVCNSHRKGNRFPISSAATRTTYETKNKITKEARLLFDSAFDPIDDWLNVDWQLQSSELVEVTPATHLKKKHKDILTTSLDFFRINVDKHLVKERQTVLDSVTQAIDDDDAILAQSLAVRYSPQSFVARAVIKALKPAYLPSLQFEQDWLLSQISNDINRLTMILDRHEDARSAIELDELLWTLATLLAAPPSGNDRSVRTMCTNLGITGQIESRAAQLV